MIKSCANCRHPQTKACADLCERYPRNDSLVDLWRPIQQLCGAMYKTYWGCTKPKGHRGKHLAIASGYTWKQVIKKKRSSK